MSHDKKHNILFVLNDDKGGITPKLPEICADLVKKGHDVHVIYPSEVDEEFEVNLRKVPWIHAQKMNIDHIFTASQLSIPLDIRTYINRHDGIDVIHSFGLMPGVLSKLGTIFLKSAVFNTPDVPVVETGKKQGMSLFQRFILDNVTYVFNRLYGKIIFTSEAEQKAHMEHISYRNLQTEFLNEKNSTEELVENLLKIYSNTITSIAEKKKK